MTGLGFFGLEKLAPRKILINKQQFDVNPSRILRPLGWIPALVFSINYAFELSNRLASRMLLFILASLLSGVSFVADIACRQVFVHDLAEPPRDRVLSVDETTRFFEALLTNKKILSIVMIAVTRFGSTAEFSG